MFAECCAPRVLIGSRRASLDNSGWFAVRLTFAGIAKHLSAGAGHTESPSMSLLTTSIQSTRLTRWNFGLVALTLLGVFAIALALMLPNSITP